ncbi:hypothetical protein LR48_Vigan05g133600 [Vigna angularis]|uniref:Homologous recombination OB-fold protein OB-fold domain-containing protein n=1 Tax=Phaseolus angularis TaxID=3914 RepID=A0A0L9UM01_PHAAN|nr:hypothetical protein LR48_Vigan05g133600 [Vigna angularis]
MEAWEELDIDESDLDSFIRRCNSNNNVIPGPAGVIEAAMINRQVNENISTQVFLSDIAKASFERLLLKHEVEHISTLDSLKGTCKVSLLRCLVKASEHNGLGDMKITIRDPTGTVKASVHHKAIDHPEIGPHLKVGSVIILQDVFPSDIGCPTDDLVRLTVPIVMNNPPTRSVDHILSKLIPPVHNDKPERSGSNNNN